MERARAIIERGESDRLTMRRLADEMGIQAPSLYKHFADKGAIQRALYVDYLVAMRDAMVAAREAEDAAGHPLEPRRARLSGARARQPRALRLRARAAVPACGGGRRAQGHPPAVVPRGR